MPKLVWLYLTALPSDRISAEAKRKTSVLVETIQSGPAVTHRDAKHPQASPADLRYDRTPLSDQQQRWGGGR